MLIPPLESVSSRVGFFYMGIRPHVVLHAPTRFHSTLCYQNLQDSLSPDAETARLCV